MRKSLYLLAVTVILLVGIAVTGTGCSKKVAAPPPAAAPPEPPAVSAPTPSAPVISLTASPAAIERGQSTTLSWRSTNATEITIDGGIGTVEATGSRTVAPNDSITYRARAIGPGGSSNAEVRVTVTAPAVAPPAPRPLADAEWFPKTIQDAFFDYDRYDIRDDARQALQQDSRAFGERTHIRFTIEGHCDERGSEAYNLALGDKRANAARDFLISQGIDPSRIDTISYGEERPFDSGHNEQAWQQNRRAHFVMK